MKYDLSKIVTRSNGEAIETTKGQMTLRDALVIMLESQPIDVDAEGGAKARVPTMKETMDRIAVLGKINSAADGLADLTAEDVALLKPLALVSLAYPVAMFALLALEHPIGE